MSKKSKMLNLILLISFFSILFPCHHQQSLSFPCTPACNCELAQNDAYVTCLNIVFIDYSQFNQSLNLLLGLSVKRVYAKLTNSVLNDFLDKLCTLTNNENILKIIYSLDVYNSKINDHISTSLKCLTALDSFYFNYNLLKSIDENAFNFDNKLSIIDLSSNKLTTLSPYLFASRLPFLTSLNLRDNLIKELDTWYLYLPKIQYITLGNNMISKFTNSLKWDIYGNNSATRKSNFYVYLNENNVTRLGDEFLRTYGLCNQTKFLDFLKLSIYFEFYGNKIGCSCNESYNLLRFIEDLTPNYLDVINANGFNGLSCNGLNELNIYDGESVLRFENSTKCESSSISIDSNNCPLYTITSQNFQNNATFMLEKKNYSINERIKITLNINYFQRAQYLVNIGERSGFFYIANESSIVNKTLNIAATFSKPGAYSIIARNTFNEQITQETLIVSGLCNKACYDSIKVSLNQCSTANTATIRFFNYNVKPNFDSVLSQSISNAQTIYINMFVIYSFLFASLFNNLKY